MSNSLSDGWRSVTIGDVVEKIEDNLADPESSGFERYLKVEHLDADSLKIRRWGLLKDGDLPPTFRKVFRKGQVLYPTRNPHLRRTAYADFDGICGEKTLVLQAREELEPDLMPFLFQQERLIEYATSAMIGSTNPHIRWRDLAAFEFTLPPMDEQCRIAAILWAAEEAIEAAKKVINAIDLTIEVFRIQKFGRFEDTSISLADLCEADGIQIGPFGSQLHASDYVEDGIPVIMPSDMVSDEVSEAEIARITLEKAMEVARHKVLPGDILLPRRGDFDRRAYIYPKQEGWICGTGSIRVRVRDGISTRAVLHALASKKCVSWLNRFSVGTTMPNLNTDIVSKIPIALPVGDELRTSVEAIERLQDNKELAVERWNSLKSVKAALLREFVAQ